MGKDIRILIADENSDLRRLLAACLEREPDMHVVGVTSMGGEALELIDSLEPDILVMDSAFSDMDRTSFLEELALMDESVRPAAVVLSRYREKLKLRGLVATGISKPMDISDITRKIRSSAHLRAVGKSEWAVGTNGEYGLAVTATRMLSELGVPTHLAGYYYLREAAVMTALNVNLIGAVTKELYPEVAKRFGVTPSQVERAMRTVIEYSWGAADDAVIWKYFGTRLKRKPSNSEFISVLADKLYLQRKYIEYMM